MIVGLGIDLLETARLARAIAQFGERFECRVFTDGERRQCADRRDRLQALAARFAAKEALLKAFGTGLRAGLSLRQIEVVRAASGRPHLELAGAAAEHALALGVRTIHLSLSHQPAAALAVVVLEG